MYIIYNYYNFVAIVVCASCVIILYKFIIQYTAIMIIIFTGIGIGYCPGMEMVTKI